MFTGIITAIGTVISSTPITQTTPRQGHTAAPQASSAFGMRLHIQAPMGYLDDVAVGDSIALQGSCMTVVEKNTAESVFIIEISHESLSVTTFLEKNKRINLEKALRASDRLGGHIVSGHVDGIGHVKRFDSVGESWLLQILCPPALSLYLAYKGSITINGVSLTINQVEDTPEGSLVSINLIAHTLTHTTLGDLQLQSPVNIEIDTIARYVHRMMTWVK